MRFKNFLYAYRRVIILFVHLSIFVAAYWLAFCPAF